MTNTEIVAQLATMTVDFFQFMLPVVAFLAGVNWVWTTLISVLFREGKL